MKCVVLRSRCGRKECRINTVPDDADFSAFYSETLLGCREHHVNHVESEAKPYGDAFVRVPERDFLAMLFPESPAQHDVLGIHVHEHRVVLVDVFVNQFSETQRIRNTRCGTALLAQAENTYIRGQCMRAFLETYHGHPFTLFCELLYPAMEKAQNRVIGINYLCDD